MENQSATRRRTTQDDENCDWKKIPSFPTPNQEGVEKNAAANRLSSTRRYNTRACWRLCAVLFGGRRTTLLLVRRRPRCLILTGEGGGSPFIFEVVRAKRVRRNRRIVCVCESSALTMRMSPYALVCKCVFCVCDDEARL